MVTRKDPLAIAFDTVIYGIRTVVLEVSVGRRKSQGIGERKSQVKPNPVLTLLRSCSADGSMGL